MRYHVGHFRSCGIKETNETYEAVVDLVGDRVDSWTHKPGVCPNFTIDEYHEVDHALHEHPEVLARLAARGITDPSLVLFDVWTYGEAMMPEQWRDRRLGLVRPVDAGDAEG